MQVIVNGTDQLEHLIAARHVIEELIANRQMNAPAPTHAIPQDKQPAPPAPAPAPEKPKKPKVVKAISADEVRAVMVEKAKAGKDAEIRAMLKEQFSVDRLSQVPIEQLPALKAMVEAL